MDKIANLVLVSAGILSLFGIIIAVGIVYNSARVGLQERAWELLVCAFSASAEPR
jgi:putative ABC transport system permease protein